RTASPRVSSTSWTPSGSSKPVTRLAAWSAQARSGRPAGVAPVRDRPSSQTREATLSAFTAVTVAVQPAAGAVRTCRPSPLGRHSLSFRRSVSFSVIGFSDWFARMFGAVEGQQRWLAVDDRFHVDRSAPDELEVGQHVFRPVLPQLDAVEIVLEQQL